MHFAFLIFDVETNGLQPHRCSVLSFSALHVHTWRENGSRRFEVQDEFDRYYYPLEPYNPRAIQVNGLTADVISQKRSLAGINYPPHFNEDQEVPAFCGRSGFAVCHNTPFDAKFLMAAHSFEFQKTFCTMRGFTEYCSIPHPFYGIKWPKLEEAVEFICGRDDFSFHDSLADCYAVLELLKIMGNSEERYGRLSWAALFDEVFA